jgi:hypothetical protein
LFLNELFIRINVRMMAIVLFYLRQMEE